MTDKQARRESRITAVKALFSYFARDEKIEINDVFAHVLEESESAGDDFAEAMVQTAVEHVAKLRVIIRAYAPEFAFEKIAPINRSILIAGLTELKYFDTPPIVVINEYIEIAKLFGESRSANFINGVLDAFRKSIGKERESD